MRKRNKKFGNLNLVLVLIIIYLIIGLIFTILRSNAYYEHFMIESDFYTGGNKSYWDARCIEDNNMYGKIYGTPGATWCLDGFGKFHTEKPNKLTWFFIYYSSHKSHFFTTILFWPLHLIGIDMIHFRSVAGAWRYG